MATAVSRSFTSLWPSADGPVLQCPACRSRLSWSNDGAHCDRCSQRYVENAEGQRDLRLKAGQVVVNEACYAPLPYDETIDVPLRREQPCSEARNQLCGNIPVHLTPAQVSYLPAARDGDCALDLGCGRGIHRGVIESLGYRYHGADFSGSAADDLVDAHTLPYADNQFSLIVSIAVLEHLADPVRALQEAARVLRPDGFFAGTVAFLEPFHDNSFYHFTHLGLWHALRSAGFSVEAIMPIDGWHVARAQLEMGFGARLPQWLTRTLSAPFALLVRSYAALGRVLGDKSTRHDPDLTLARHAGAFFFIGSKRVAPIQRRPCSGIPGK